MRKIYGVLRPKIAGLGRTLLLTVLGVTLLLGATLPAEAAVSADRSFLTALVALASYEGDMSALVREALAAHGWEFQSFAQTTSAAQARFHVVSKTLNSGEKCYILAFPGTERLKDAEVDLRFERVAFAGTTPAEFLAARDNKSLAVGSSPLVHRGFNDYTQVALFTERLPEYDGLTAGEVIARDLREHPEYRLCLTGHSLGGAVATLAAARLADMGARPEQLQVVTFGAPAVGNAAFARAYENQIDLTRITISGDPVKSVLQSLTGGYVQFGDAVKWRQSKVAARFEHEMVVYLDAAMRSYHDAGATDSELLAGPRQATSAPVYVAPLALELDKTLAADEKYLTGALKSTISEEYHDVIIGSGDPAKSRAEARAAGAGYTILKHLKIERIRSAQNTYRLTLGEELYDASGALLTMQENSTTTAAMTPLEAAVYLEYQAKNGRAPYIK